MAPTTPCIIPLRKHAETSSVSAADVAPYGGRTANHFSASATNDSLYQSPESVISIFPLAKTEIKIGKTLMSFGIPPHMKGYIYLREAVLMLYDDESSIFSITKLMYPPIARKFTTTVPRVEKAIRHAIETSWNRGAGTAIRNCFHYHDTRPTNSEFVAYFFQSLSMNLFE